MVDPVTLKVTGVRDVAIYNDCFVTVQNNTGKKIQWTEFNLAQYNYKGKRVYGPYSYYYDDNVIPAYGSSQQYYWVHNDAKTCKASIRSVKFTDGSKWK